MSSATHISTLYREFADALRDVLAENAVGLASHGRLARTRAAVKKHPDYSEHGYFLAVELAFKQWEAMQNDATKVLRPRKMVLSPFYRQQLAMGVGGT